MQQTVESIREYCGKMIKPHEYKCEYSQYSTEKGKVLDIENVFSTAWEADGKRVQIFVNHTAQKQTIEFAGKTIVIEALDAVMEEQNC